jgi:hypothetical protein
MPHSAATAISGSFAWLLWPHDTQQPFLPSRTKDHQSWAEPWANADAGRCRPPTYFLSSARPREAKATVNRLISGSACKNSCPIPVRNCATPYPFLPIPAKLRFLISPLKTRKSFDFRRVRIPAYPISTPGTRTTRLMFPEWPKRKIRPACPSQDGVDAVSRWRTKAMCPRSS